ncbi:MAG: ATP-binding cassette domain-containing protein [Ignavibacteria bacterium]
MRSLTGGGKSTLLSLIPRFYDSVSGEVKIDGVNVSDYKLTEMRNQIGFVLRIRFCFLERSMII